MWKEKKSGTVQKTFALPKEGHTVTAKNDGEKLQVVIASDRESDILAMLVDAKAEVATDPSRTPSQQQQIVKDLEGARQMVQAMNQDWIATPNQSLDFKSWAEIRLTQIVNILAHLGADGIKAFSDFKGRPLDKRYLPTGYDVREKLYLRGSGWSGNQSSVSAKGRAEAIADVMTVINNRAADPTTAAAAWKRLEVAQIVPDGSSITTLSLQHFNNTKFDVDHSAVLSIHWQSGGNNNGDADRWNLSDVSKLRYITKRDNLARAKGSYLIWVGKAFVSVYAQGGQINAKQIDGQPFLDAPNGNPL